ncbi:hypothetical protein D3C84_1155990 [compost metagenome]
MINEIVNAGPAVKAPVPVKTKIPVPTIAPTPIKMRSTGPRTFLSDVLEFCTLLMSIKLLVLKILTLASSIFICGSQ